LKPQKNAIMTSKKWKDNIVIDFTKEYLGRSGG